MIQTCNHFVYKKDKIINEDEEIKLKEKLEKAIKKDNTIRLKNLLNERSEENTIEKAIQRINEIESKKQYVEFMKEKKRKQKMTKRINQSYLIEEGIKHINTRNKEFPNPEQTKAFWENIIGTERNIDLNNERINRILNQLEIGNIEWPELTKEEMESAIKSTPNWKAPGPDKINGIFLKKLKASKGIFEEIKEIIGGRKEIEEDMVIGRTVLIYKKGNEKEPKNYRPITCLSVITKLITSIISRRLQYIYMNPLNMIMSDKQKGVMSGIMGTKECIIEALATRG